MEFPTFQEFLDFIRGLCPRNEDFEIPDGTFKSDAERMEFKRECVINALRGS